MYQLIKSLFIEKGFRTLEANEGFCITEIDTENYFLAINSIGRKEYYLVIFIKNIDGLQLLELIRGDYIRKCFNSIKIIDNLYEKEMDKNSSLIFCLESELINESDLDIDSKQKYELLKKAIYEVEEDPYFFKKYILTYYKEQIDEITPEIVGITLAGERVTDYLQTSLNDTGIFKRYKENPLSQRKYDLICKLFIKLPFLKLTNLEMSTLRNLKDKIIEELIQKDIVIDDELISYLSELEVGTFELKDLDNLIKRLG